MIRGTDRPRRALSTWLAACAFAATAGVGVPAVRAEIYECVGLDGKVRFTGDPSQCARARPHTLKREIQLEDRSKARARRSPARARARPAARSTAGQEQMWRRRQTQARAKLDAVEVDWQRGRQMVTACNRGSSWWGTDASGIRRKISCNTLKSEFAKLEQQRQELREYLDGGLAEECRRAGCLPGWLRD